MKAKKSSIDEYVEKAIASKLDAERMIRDIGMYTPVLTWSGETNENRSASALYEAKETIKELQETLERVAEDALILYRIDRLSKDKKHAFVRKGESDLRIKSVKGLQKGDEVLLHPKTMQIVEHLGRPPLEVSRFAPSSTPSVTWEDIGGLEDAKADLIEAIELPHSNKELFKYYNKRTIKGILLSGPPGCGKTMLGKAAANCLAKIYGKEKSKTGFLYVKGPEILNQYVGATEETIRDMFDDARRHKEINGYPAIIFIDEADAILATRGTRSAGIGNTIVPMFLTEMDGLEDSGAIVILATNRPDILDPAVVRDGRIDRKIEIKRPDIKNASYILNRALSSLPISNEYSFDHLADGMAQEIYSEDRYVRDDTRLRDVVNGAMLAGCVDLAVSFAIKRDISKGVKSGVTPEDIVMAVDRIQSQQQTIKHNLEDQ